MGKCQSCEEDLRETAGWSEPYGAILACRNCFHLRRLCDKCGIQTGVEDLVLQDKKYKYYCKKCL